MATVTKALARIAAATSSTTLYTVPASTTTVITNIIVTNTVTADATFSLLLDDVSIATTKIIAGLASAITVKFHISGVEIS